MLGKGVFFYFSIIMTAAEATEQREYIRQQRYEAYESWRESQLSDPRFASVRMLFDDASEYGEVQDVTWERFDVEERTWGAEILNAPHSHIDRFRFDGADIIVKESDGVNSRTTLRDVYQNGLEKTRKDVVAEPGLAYQLRRDELFMAFYEQIEAMMRGETDHDTIHMISTCPIPEELSNNPDEAQRLMKLRWYDNVRRKSFDYTARRLPNGELELSATTLDSSNMQAHAAVLQAHGYENVAFGMISSHEFSRFLSFDKTLDQPIESVIGARVTAYDASLEAQTGRRHKYGREDDTIDAHAFFDEHCEEYWVGYKACHEMLAKHLAGQALHGDLQKYLLQCLSSQEKEGKSVLNADKLYRLRTQLESSKITFDMAMSCRELLVYDHHATLTELLKEFKKTGRVTKLQYANGGDFMGAYAESASSNGAAAAANGEVFAGCETATEVTTLTTAASVAAQSGKSIEQVLREQDKEARHCLEIQLYGYTIRRGVHCPFCDKEVDAKDTKASIECLDADCATILDKATGKTRKRLSLTSFEQDEAIEQPLTTVVSVTNGTYKIGDVHYRRRLVPVVGGAKLVYTDEEGAEYIGLAAERLEAIIASQIAVAAQAS